MLFAGLLFVQLYDYWSFWLIWDLWLKSLAFVTLEPVAQSRLS